MCATISEERGRNEAGSGSPAPLLTFRGAVLALALGVLLGWPMLATGGYLTFADTWSYIRGGEVIWGMLIDFADFGGGTGGGGGLGGGSGATDGGGGPPLVNDRGQPVVLRSFPYSLYTLFAGASLWPAGFALLQAAAVLYMLFALIGPAAVSRPRVLAAGFACLVFLSTLPWFAAYLMPDLLAAAVILWGAILIRRFDVLTGWQRWVLGAVAAFAVAAHYGHLPLAAGLFALVLLWRVVTRRLTWALVLAAVLPVVLAPLANLAASTVALDTPSATPLRLPILLARSIQDGPARWYLEEACPEADLAFCRAFDDVPGDMGAFLWGEEGIDSLTPEEMAGIRAEEFTILSRAFLAYPVAQTVSLAGNTVEQVFKFGTGQIGISRWLGGSRFEDARTPRSRVVLGTFDIVVQVTTWAGAALLFALWVSGRLDRDMRAAAAVVVLGLLINAAVFGGLSAPVDRYQARVAWLLPALAVIALAASWRRTERGG